MPQLKMLAKTQVECGTLRAQLTVTEGPRLLMMGVDEENGPKGGYWAIWDKRTQRSFPSSATWTAQHLIRVMDNTAPVLLLGLGGAMIPGNLLHGGHNGNVTAVELCPAVIDLCKAHFLPRIFSQSSAPKAKLLRILHADAGDVASFAPHLDERPAAVVVDFPPAYVRPRSMPPAFWVQLWQLASPCSQFVINTIFQSAAETQLLAAELAAAGWTRISGPIAIANACGHNGTKSAGRCNRIMLAMKGGAWCTTTSQGGHAVRAQRAVGHRRDMSWDIRPRVA